MDVFIPDVIPILVAALASGGPPWGKAAFVGVFVLLLIWLLIMPARLIGNDQGQLPWWRNCRVWAVAVAIVQIFVYLSWG